MKPIALSWSSGKDAAYALYLLQQSPIYQVEHLFCTLDKEKSRVSMHGVREELLDQQVNALGLPLRKILLPSELPLNVYNGIIDKELSSFKESEIETIAYGDILLENLKLYRETQLQSLQLQGLFPLWKKDTTILAKEIIESGIKAIVVAASAKHLNKSFIGRLYDAQFLVDLPEDVDPCGENGEFHTFVYDAPNFKYPVPFEIGEIVKRSYVLDDNKDEPSWDTSFWFCDLLLK